MLTKTAIETKDQLWSLCNEQDISKALDNFEMVLQALRLTSGLWVEYYSHKPQEIAQHIAERCFEMRGICAHYKRHERIQRILNTSSKLASEFHKLHYAKQYGPSNMELAS